MVLAYYLQYRWELLYEKESEMAVDRLLPTDEGAELVALIREIAQARAGSACRRGGGRGAISREAFTLLGEAGLLGLPYPEEYGGAGQPYEVYLQALEEVALAWLSVGVGVSVHVMTLLRPGQPSAHRNNCSAICPEMIGGRLWARLRCRRPRRDLTSRP